MSLSWQRVRREAIRVFRRAARGVWKRDESQIASPTATAVEPALEPLARRFASQPHPRIAVVSSTADHRIAQAVRVTWPGARVRVVDPTAGESATHVTLAAAGPFDAVVDVEADPGRPARIRAVFFHLVRDGVLVVVDAATASTDARAAETVAARLLASLVEVSVRAALAPGAEQRPDDACWGRAVAAVEIRDRHLILTSTQGASAKIREEELQPFLQDRGERFGRVLSRRQGSTVENPAPILASESAAAITYRTRFEAPPLLLREYVRPTCSHGQVVTKANVLLPETYRRVAWARLGNMFTEEVAPRFARLKRLDEVEDVAGAWFHLDSEYRGHFGHALTEQISRLWAWAEAKERYPDLKALMLASPWRTTVGEWERRLYEAAGVAREDLVLFDHPVRPERLLGATPMFCQPQYVHAGIRQIYRRVGDALAVDAPERPYPDRIFCSRRHDKRSATNTAEIEKFFAARGFEIVYPEDYPMSEQVQMFRSATELAGFGGSAMFTMAFVPEPKRVFLVSAETYKAQNEAMIAAAQGHQLNVAWCRPVLTGPDAEAVKDKTQARFTFDFEREGDFLRRLLD